MRRLLEQMQNYEISHKLSLRSQFFDNITESDLLCALGVASNVSRQPRGWKKALLLCYLQRNSKWKQHYQ